MVFEEDSSVKRGGAVVETMFGEVDARLENQLKEIKTALLHIK
jgi:flagellar biosynthesis/type III secretory pathway protein FliH